MGEVGEDSYPKRTRGVGTQKYLPLAKSLVAKGGWRILKMENLLSHVMIQKYISAELTEDWIRCPE